MLFGSRTEREVVWTGSLGYRARMAEHHAAVEPHGVSLGFPDEQLVKDARDYAAERDRRWGTFQHQRIGYAPRLTNVTGQIGAELLARAHGTHADWGFESDPGWDFILPPPLPPLKIESKTRVAFLSLQPDEFKRAPDFYALVEHADAKSPYIFCGVVTYDDLDELGFIWRFRGHPLLSVTAAALMTPAAFQRQLERGAA